MITNRECRIHRWLSRAAGRLMSCRSSPVTRRTAILLTIVAGARGCTSPSEFADYLAVNPGDFHWAIRYRAVANALRSLSYYGPFFLRSSQRFSG